jgi:flagellar basal body rod protein FlgC
METSSQRQKTINNRMYSRNIPSQPLQPYLDSRPVLTKYSVLPIFDTRPEIKTQLIQTSTYNPHNVFNPGNDSAPWSGYATNVNVESELRNQVYALQKCDQAIYVPNSKSNLYNVKWNNLDNSLNQPFPTLFKEERFSPFNPNPEPNKVGYSLFNNATRQQVKDLTN